MERNTPGEGERFLHKTNPNLQLSQPVKHEQARLDMLDEERTPAKPAERIADWMAVLERTHGHDDTAVLDRIKASYHREYVIKPESVPESVFLLEQRIAREQGHGDVPITNEFREAKIAQIIRDQEDSLDKWVDYLTSDDATYPTWAKYWAFTSMVKMGKFEKTEVELPDGSTREVGRFGRRDESTIAPFPPLNPRALALAIDVMTERLHQKELPKSERTPQPNASTKLTDEEFAQLLTTQSFSKLYTQFLIEMPEYSAEGMRETRGEWRKYERGSDPQPLVDSLDGYPMEWCTAGLETARSQLEGGDFYVYYSLDGNGEARTPRVAIRMTGDSIAEVRGILPNQNLDPYISDVVSAKMAEFHDGESYQQKAADMKWLTEIEDLVKSGGEPSNEDLRFLYELDRPIMGFGYERDPRIGELTQARDVRQDLVRLLGCRPDQISLSQYEALSGDIVYHHGGLKLSNLTSAEGFILPQSVGGNIYLNGLTSAEGLTLPKSVGGDLYLYSLIAAEGLTLPQSVGGDLYLYSLTSAESLTLPQSVGGDLDLGGLTSAEGLTFPQSVGGNLDLGGLTSAEGLTLPQSVGGELDLRGLTSADGLTLPQSVGGGLYLGGLTSAEDLALPQSVGGGLYLHGLTSADGLTLPQTVGGGLDLRGLTSAEGLTLPQSVGGRLYLSNLTSAEGLILPQTVGGGLDLGGLTSAEGLTLPQSVGGGLYLYSLTSAEGLTLPQSVGGGLYLGGLTSAEGLTLPQSVGGGLYLHGLTSAEGLILPQTVGGGLDLGGLTSAEGLTFPQSVGGNLDLNGLTSAEGLTFPQSVGGGVDLRGLMSAEIETIRTYYPNLRIY